MPTESAYDTNGRRYGRRTFIAVVAGGLSSLLWARPAWRTVSGALHPAADLLPKQVREVVPSGWRIYTVTPSMPRFDPAIWRLRIDGLVAQPVELTYEQLRALPRSEQTSDFHCVTGWSVNNVRWAGVRFHDLLAQARPLPQARAVGFLSADGAYADTLTLQQSLLQEVMLAYEMDGKPLAREHGAPTRLVIPEMYGYKNVKWVDRITLLKQPLAGYWEVRGYDVDAWVGRSNGYGSGA